MTNECRYSVIMTTCDTETAAEQLAEALVVNHLAACVQITTINSFYEWEGEVKKDKEFLLLIKSKSENYETIESFISDNHDYDVPEIVEVPIHRGLKEYLGFIDDVTG